MNCPKCSKYYNDKDYVPLNLPCGHTYCRICIRGLYKVERSIDCPVCLTV